MVSLLALQLFICYTVAVEFVQFRRHFPLDGRVCSAQDIVFQANPVSEVGCLDYCTRYSACRSVFSKQDTRECVGCSRLYWGLNVTSAMAGAKFFQRTAKYQEYCAIDDECMLPYQFCWLKKCRCQPGYPYSPSQAKCFTECTSYGSTFQTFEYSKLDLPVTEMVQNISFSTLGPCRDLCVSRSWCRSFDHSASQYTCKLRAVTAVSNPSAFKVDTSFYHYNRNCL